MLKNQKQKKISTNSAFNEKVQDEVHSILSNIQDMFKKKIKSDGKGREVRDQLAQFQFQLLDLRFVVNWQKGLPELIGIGLSPFEGAVVSDPQMQMAKLFKQGIISLLFKIDR